jgi:hypothetical protein
MPFLETFETSETFFKVAKVAKHSNFMFVADAVRRFASSLLHPVTP